MNATYDVSFYEVDLARAESRVAELKVEANNAWIAFCDAGRKGATYAEAVALHDAAETASRRLGVATDCRNAIISDFVAAQSA